MRKGKVTKKSATATKPVVVANKATVVEKSAESEEDLYIVIGRERHPFASQISPFYDVKEYFWTGELVNGADIKFVHGDGTEVPTHQNRNCGYTLVGKAKSLIKANKALTTPGEPSDDQEYVYINEHSTLTYVGDTASHTVYVRVYDNNSGTVNDRWVVIYID